MPPLHVYITIDTEFSARGFFVGEPRRLPVGPQAARCEIDGRSHGVGVLLETFRRHSVPATFFVEAARVLYFGPEPMGGIAREIRDAGHDLQLHLHAMWLTCEKATDPDGARAAYTGDSMAGLPPERLDRLLEVGIGAFDAWGVPRPVAARAGNLKVDRAVYAAMARHGLPLASHLGIGVFRPAERELQLHGGRHRIDGVVELPVLSFRDYRRTRTLTVAGTTFREMRCLLERAHAAGLEEVVVLTHPHEFVRRHDMSYERLSPNGTNRRRLDRLCGFLAGDPDRFRTTTFAAEADRLLASPPTADARLGVPLVHALGRDVAQWVLGRLE